MDKKITEKFVNDMGKEMTASISISDPEEGNDVKVTVRMDEGQFNKDHYSGYCTDFQYSAESSDPNDWENEAIEAAKRAGDGWYLE
ncbi:hypothetical protein Cylst_5173 [Cylindrospermum stagnale PCC 7417]|uniref:Uncharacterized protein n=1 Tax=Cylindrospermum stagnale PCC 7417 TaxID=56107 RepID=K9X433_9NOST|nr:hypothetical protein [Cylindrospermum stagnale]AFZ27213.1 hypothetical protein Cylst_5173 [Cylindrospermum stagnale PCC 7417]